jgi:hypothetical protein
LDKEVYIPAGLAPRQPISSALLPFFTIIFELLQNAITMAA